MLMLMFLHHHASLHAAIGVTNAQVVTSLEEALSWHEALVCLRARCMRRVEAESSTKPMKAGLGCVCMSGGFSICGSCVGRSLSCGRCCEMESTPSRLRCCISRATRRRLGCSKAFGVER